MNEFVYFPCLGKIKGCNKKGVHVKIVPYSCEICNFWELEVNAIFYIECVGVPIMYQDEFLTFNLANFKY